MNLTEYIEQKRKSLVATNKNLSDEKLRVEGAWLILQEIEKMVETAPTLEGNDATEEENPSPKSKTKKRSK